MNNNIVNVNLNLKLFK